jgi:hypothetical protein
MAKMAAESFNNGSWLCGNGGWQPAGGVMACSWQYQRIWPGEICGNQHARKLLAKSSMNQRRKWQLYQLAACVWL